MSFKTCKDCCESKALENYPNVKVNKDGKGPRCKPCNRIFQKNARCKHPFKKCNKCGQEKKITEFYERAGKCKPCTAEVSKQYNQTHKKKWSIKTGERICSVCKIHEKYTEFTPNNHRCKKCSRVKYIEYYQKNEELIKEKSRKNSAKKNKICSICKKNQNETLFTKCGGRCIKCNNLYMKQYINKNQIALRIKKKIYRHRNKEKISEYRKANLEKIKERFRNLYKNDINVRLSKILRAHLYRALIRSKNKKTTNYITLLGCSKDYFIKYIESLMSTGMTWTNYGLWHIDHIKPIASFDLKIIEEQYECFAYNNMQPLWGRDNQVKNKEWSIWQEWIWKYRLYED